MKFPRTAQAATVFALASTAVANNNLLTPDKFEADIKTEELQNVLWNLNRIAKDNGGNRAFGEPGYKASVDFILERAKTRFHSDFDTIVQPFNHTYDKTLEITVTGPEGEDVFKLSPQYNPATPAEGIKAALIDTPVDDENGSMCLAEQWEGIDATGKLALVKRGACAVSEKLKFAKLHGALGVILYNEDPGTNFPVPTLGAENIGLMVPTAIIPLDVGEGWSARLAAGEEVVVSLLVDAISETRESWNVIAETKKGDPNNVIMLGAHLDSVQLGAGINDDGTGTAALLEMMTALRYYDGYKQKIRFAWWGAEESGLVGSLYYLSQLPQAEINKIKYFFNYDMIGSPYPVFEVSVNEISGIGPQLLGDYLVSKGKEVTFTEFGTGSDHVGFVDLGIPGSAIHTGAGEPWDPCYHQACDNLDNIDYDALTVNSKAAARALATLANSLEGVPEHRTTSPNLRIRGRMAQNFKRWASLAKEASHGHTCNHKGEKQRV